MECMEESESNHMKKNKCCADTIKLLNIYTHACIHMYVYMYVCIVKRRNKIRGFQESKWMDGWVFGWVLLKYTA